MAKKGQFEWITHHLFGPMYIVYNFMFFYTNNLGKGILFLWKLFSIFFSMLQKGASNFSFVMVGGGICIPLWADFPEFFFCMQANLCRRSKNVLKIEAMRPRIIIKWAYPLTSRVQYTYWKVIIFKNYFAIFFRQIGIFMLKFSRFCKFFVKNSHAIWLFTVQTVW